MIRRIAAELLGTGFLVFFGVGVATLMLGFGAAGASIAAGVVAIALACRRLLGLIGIPITGTSVNPARSLGPALIVGGTALSQIWLFIVAPLVGGLVAAGLHRLLYPEPEPESLASGDIPPPIAGSLNSPLSRRSG